MTHECKHEADFGRMAETIERMDKEIFGNGKKGLSHTVTELCVEVRELKTTADHLRTAVSGLVKYESQREGAEKRSTKNLKIIGVVIAFLSLLIMGMVGYAEINRKQEIIVNEIRDMGYEPVFREGNYDEGDSTLLR